MLIREPEVEFNRPETKSDCGDHPLVVREVVAREGARNLVKDEGDIPNTPVTLLAILDHLASNIGVISSHEEITLTRKSM